MSQKPAKGRNYDELVKALRDRAETKARVGGDVEWEVDAERIVVRGESLRVTSEPDYMSGNSGELIFATTKEQSMSFRFNGRAKMQRGDFRASADQLILESDTIKLTGKAKVSFDEQRPDSFLFDFQSFSNRRFVLTGDSISIRNDTEFEVSGNGHYSHPIADGVPVEMSAERFLWNSETNELKVIP